MNSENSDRYIDEITDIIDTIFLKLDFINKFDSNRYEILVAKFKKWQENFSSLKEKARISSFENEKKLKFHPKEIAISQFGLFYQNKNFTTQNQINIANDNNFTDSELVSLRV